MTTRIWVLRHGEAERNTRHDPSRELTERGAQHAQAAGEWLAKTASPAVRLVASPYRRAQQTAAQVARAFADKTITTVDWLVPDIDPDEALDELAKLGDREIIVVSHQPLVSALLGLLIAADYRAGPAMETASLAALTTSIIAPGCATLISLQHAPSYDTAVR
ncbi:MAG: phosphohistidine phosphatase SixA [Verrucomicrobiaceae bacterium]|nr:phosphohistidine phosphatase SixA [Verrucomicrobiaceae bacterium]